MNQKLELKEDEKNGNMEIPENLKDSIFYQKYPEYDLTVFQTDDDSADVAKINKILKNKSRYTWSSDKLCIYCGTPVVGLDQDYYDRQVGQMIGYHPIVGWNTLWNTLIWLAVLGALAAAFLGLSVVFVAGPIGFAVLVWQMRSWFNDLFGIRAIGTVCPGHAELEQLRLEKKEALSEKSLIRFQWRQEKKGRIHGWDEKLVMDQKMPLWERYNLAQMKRDGFEAVQLMGPHHVCPRCGHEWQNPYPETTILAVHNEEQVIDRKVLADGKTKEQG